MKSGTLFFLTSNVLLGIVATDDLPRGTTGTGTGTGTVLHVVGTADTDETDERFDAMAGTNTLKVLSRASDIP